MLIVLLSDIELLNINNSCSQDSDVNLQNNQGEISVIFKN